MYGQFIIKKDHIFLFSNNAETREGERESLNFTMNAKFILGWFLTLILTESQERI